MALYHQLSEELEETNRGVVALYAELDEKSAQLRAASEAKSRFLANVSHELRAPVTAIIGLGRLLTDDVLRPAHRRAGPPGRADPRLGRRPAVAGQRPARPGQGGGRPDRAELDRRRPAGRLRPAARHAAAAGHPARGGASSSTEPAVPAAAHRRGAARPGAAQPAHQRAQVHRRGLGAADASARSATTSSSPSPTPAPASRRAARADLRGVLPGARQSRRSAARAPGSACRTPAGWSASSAARCGSTSEPGEGSTFTVSPARSGRHDARPTVLVVDDSATKRYLLVSWLTRAGFTVRRGGDRRRGAAPARRGRTSTWSCST